MKIIIRGVQIADPQSPMDGKQADILIEDGIIQAIESSLEATADQEVKAGGFTAMPGWLDLLAFCGEPGEEWKEDFRSLANAASAGGFTSVAVSSGNHPYADNASAIKSVVESATSLPVQIMPLGTVTVGAAAEHLAEIFDMSGAGACGFSDGVKSWNSSGLINRVLDYTRNLGKPVYYFPYDKELAPQGKMHEGVVSTSLGLKGIPAVSESIPLEAFLNLAAWQKTSARVVGISSAAGVEIIRKAKAAGIDVKAAVPVFNLLFTDESLSDFNENHKVLPPYRSAKDRQALIQAVCDGVIDAVMSNHQPQDTENKAVEFEYAAFGASSIQTVLPVLIAAGITDLRFIYSALVSGPRKFMNLPVPTIQAGQKAELTIFSTTESWEFDKNLDFSKGVNQPLAGQSLKGQVLGTFCKNRWNPNPASRANQLKANQ